MTEKPKWLQLGLCVWDARRRVEGVIQDWHRIDGRWLVDHTGLGPGTPPLVSPYWLAPSCCLRLEDEAMEPTW